MTLANLISWRPIMDTITDLVINGGMIDAAANPLCRVIKSIVYMTKINCNNPE